MKPQVKFQTSPNIRSSGFSPRPFRTLKGVLSLEQVELETVCFLAFSSSSLTAHGMVEFSGMLEGIVGV
jgi:hypothetical protein